MRTAVGRSESIKSLMPPSMESNDIVPLIVRWLLAYICGTQCLEQRIGLLYDFFLKFIGQDMSLPWLAVHPDLLTHTIE